MRSIGVLEAKTNFSSLLDEVQTSGETVVITRHGRPVARLSPEDGFHPPRRRLSGPDLAERARQFREAQKPDPEFDRMSWEELKKIARMMPVVLDASAALAWLLPSQATATAHWLLAQADEHDFIAPDIFLWEVTNVLLVKGRSNSLVMEDAFDQLDGFNIALDDPLTDADVRQLTGVAITAGLSLFDAAYLALAIERSGMLASRDGVLLTAAMAVGVDVFDLRG